MFCKLTDQEIHELNQRTIFDKIVEQLDYGFSTCMGIDLGKFGYILQFRKNWENERLPGSIVFKFDNEKISRESIDREVGELIKQGEELIKGIIP